jgi:hypothetical protein
MELEDFDKKAPTTSVSIVNGGHIVPLEKPDLIGMYSTIRSFFIVSY